MQTRLTDRTIREPRLHPWGDRSTTQALARPEESSKYCRRIGKCVSEMIV